MDCRLRVYSGGNSQEGTEIGPEFEYNLASFECERFSTRASAATIYARYRCILKIETPNQLMLLGI